MATSSKLTTFYSILGKALGLAIVGAEAYAETQTAGASSLLEPQNLVTLIAEVEGTLAPQPATANPAPAAAPQPAAPASGIALVPGPAPTAAAPV